MNNKPLLNAFGAAVYIVGIAFLMEYLSSASGPQDNELAPITMLGLFVLSAATMAYLFLNEPVRLYFDNKKHNAIRAFLKTMLFFAGFVFMFVIAFLATA